MSIANFKLNSLTKALKTSKIEEYKSFDVVCKTKLDEFVSFNNNEFSITDVNKIYFSEKRSVVDISKIPFISDKEYSDKHRGFFKTLDFPIFNLSEAILSEDIVHSTLCTFNLKALCNINQEILECLTTNELSFIAQKINIRLNFHAEYSQNIFSKNKKEEFKESFYYCLKVKDLSNKPASIYSKTLDFKNDVFFKKGLTMMLKNTDITADDFLKAPKDSISTLRLLDY